MLFRSKNSRELLSEIENLIFDIHRDWLNLSNRNKKFEEKILQQNIEKSLSKVIYKKTEREPIVLTAII